MIVDPNWNPKNGRIIAFPPLNTSLIFGSKLPRTNPKINGISKENIWTIFASVCPDASPDTLPKELIKINGRSGIDNISITGKAALSLLSAYGGIIPIYNAALADVTTQVNVIKSIPQNPLGPQANHTTVHIIYAGRSLASNNQNPRLNTSTKSWGLIIVPVQNSINPISSICPVLPKRSFIGLPKNSHNVCPWPNTPVPRPHSTVIVQTIALITSGTNIVPAGILFRKAQIPTFRGFFLSFI